MASHRAIRGGTRLRMVWCLDRSGSRHRQNDGLYSATYTPTAAGQLTFSFTASSAGASATRTVTGTASEVLAIAPGGPPVTATTTAPDQSVRLRFDGQAGQRISLKLSAVTIPSSYISILTPDGSALGTSTYVSTSGGFADTRTLPTTGSYSILVDPQGTGTGSLTLTLYDVPPDLSASATFGADQTFTTTVPGQNARLSFDGRAGQRISAKFATAPTSTISILKPDGTALGGTSYIGASGGFVDTRTLPVNGTYSLVADPQGAVVGTTTVRLYDVPPDATATLVANGSTQLMTLQTPGQNGRFTLAGRAGERLSVKLAGSTISSALVSLLKPDGTALGGYASIGTSGGFLDTRALPADGAYTILVDPQGAATGSLSLAAYDVPADVDRNDRAERCGVQRHDSHARSERTTDVRRQHRTTREHPGRQHCDRKLVPLPPQARRNATRQHRVLRNLGRLRRHAHAPGGRHVHDPGRPTRSRYGFRGSDALQRAAGRDWNPRRRRATALDDRDARTERASRVLRDRRSDHEAERRSDHTRHLVLCRFCGRTGRRSFPRPS